MRQGLFSLPFIVVCAAPVGAGQPIHESLVECSVMIELLTGEQSSIPGQNDALDFYADASRALRNEAVRRTSQDYVERTARTKRQVWHQRWDEGQWDNPLNRGELIEWWQYCFKLGKHLDLPL